MLRNIKTALALAALAFTFGLQPAVHAQDSMNHEDKTKTLATGTFHGKVHKTSGRATVYQESDGKLVLRLTNFKNVQRAGCTRDSGRSQGRGRRRQFSPQ